MRTLLVLAEDWSEMEDAVRAAREYHAVFGVTVDTVRRDVDLSRSDSYDEKSLTAEFVASQFTSAEILNYDCLGLLVSKEKAKEGRNLYGQQQTLGSKQLIEVYVDPAAGRKVGQPRHVHSTIHEIFHALADFHKVKDTLHDYIDRKPRSLDAYREELLNRILPFHGLLPEVARKARMLVDYARSKGTPIRILEGYRSPERQDELYDSGRGVTKAKAWQSMHQYRLAFDYCFEGKTPFPPSQSRAWNDINAYARSIGLYSYGLEESFDDGHVQLTFEYSEKRVMTRAIDWTRYWTPKPVFKRDLMKGSKGPDVLELQRWLNETGFTVAEKGAGSPGSETDYFGELTRIAVSKWQKSKGIVPAEGYFGPISRRAL